MTDSTAHRPNDATARAAKAAKSSEADTTAVQPDQAPPAEADPVAELTRQNAELKDKLLRTLADMENLHRPIDDSIVNPPARCLAVKRTSDRLIELALERASGG